MTELCGIATLTAGKIIARVGSVHRFRSATAFASYTGIALIEASSGDVVRHRLFRAGDRQLNCCLHTMAITQISRDTPGRAYYQRKRAAGKSHKEALRCLKTRLSNGVYLQFLRGRGDRAGGGPGGRPGAAISACADPAHQSLPGPTNPNLQRCRMMRLDTDL
ncbi:IS110 family transposase [Rhodococcus wratislaviensis]|uniref:Transposase IS116/IS110/IS902 C-terminal domain-containing protein n=1 Tax=Rhodococcus wratislaviensis NBRC 100605 TaxID=1219028 RepID=X0R6I1_RHOWR|nr:IS110 family transposase [Rhodococcus wratislaviensis]GAF46550.1 hypothetical protein RW1_031_01350 [Rhodococcus wratislaviensis NBRC 100605]